MSEFLSAGDVSLKLIEIEDSQFILNLRTDSKLNSYISSTSEDIGAQEKWISAYKLREVLKAEYYFKILHNQMPVGTVRIYNISENSFSWGSWIIMRGASAHVAIVSALLVYKYAFERLGFERAHFQVKEGNRSVLKFHLNTGAVVIGHSGDESTFSYSKGDFEKNIERFKKWIKR